MFELSSDMCRFIQDYNRIIEPFCIRMLNGIRQVGILAHKVDLIRIGSFMRQRRDELHKLQTGRGLGNARNGLRW